MGSTQSNLNQTQFKKNWKRSDSIQNLNIWTNRHNPNLQLEEYVVKQRSSKYSDYLNEIRKENHYLVNAYEIKNQDSGFNCGQQSKRVLIERIPVRLSNVRDIPYPDCLHLYDSVLNGYEQLSKIVGFFAVDEDQIGISDRGQVKVWLNPAFEQNYLSGIKISQQQMVLEILQILNQAVDRDDFLSRNLPYLHEHLLRSENQINFHFVKAKFNEYVRQYNNSEIPLHLNCVQQIGGINYVNNWCRSNQSYGYEDNNLRKSEQLYQSKMARSSYQSQKINSQYSQPANNQNVIREPQIILSSQYINQNDKNKISYTLIKDNGTYNQSVTQPIIYQQTVVPQQYKLNSQHNRINGTIKVEPNSIIHDQRKEHVVSQPIRQQQNFNVVQFPSNVQQPSSSTVKISNQLQSSQIKIAYQPLPREMKQRIIQINQPAINRQINTIKIQNNNIQKPVNQVQGPMISQQIYIPNNAVQTRTQIQFKQPQNLPLQSQPPQVQPILIRPPSNKPPLQSTTINNYRPQPQQQNQLQQQANIIIKPNLNPKTPSFNPIYENKQLIFSNSIKNLNQNVQNRNPLQNGYNLVNEKELQQVYSNSNLRANQSSKLQQHRVISQAIEIKQAPLQEANLKNNYYNNTYNNIILQENSPSKRETQDYYQFNNDFKRIVPSSQDVIQPKYQSYAFQDDKPSPAFMALMNELMINKGTKTQLYESIGNTPISYAKNENSQNRYDYLKEANAYETYSREGSWSNDQGNKRLFQTQQRFNYQHDSKVTQKSQTNSNFQQTYKYSGNYNTQKYQLTIDEDLLADLNKYK